jgi:RNA polymerase sigma factor (TIGR02999 family)
MEMRQQRSPGTTPAKENRKASSEMDGSVSEVTACLDAAYRDEDARERLYRLIEARFRQMAGRLMRRERAGHSLQETVLVDDAFQRLLCAENPNWKNREQFFCTAAKVMRRMLVDHARKRNAHRRGRGERPLGLERRPEPADDRAQDPQKLLELNDIVERLEAEHPESFKVFNLHYFMGYELKEIAKEILDMPYTTVKRRWGMAKAFLHRELVNEETE